MVLEVEMTCPFTDEQLAAWSTAGAEAGIEWGGHVARCPSCQTRLTALQRMDQLLRQTITQPVPAALAERVRATLQRQWKSTEILTLEEVAAFLHLSIDQLDEITDELPAFELAGQIRVRKTKLLEWIEARERAYLRAITQSRTRRIIHGGADSAKGVA